MSRPVELDPGAEQDLADARDWHEAQRTGLSGELLLAIDAVIVRIAGNPKVGARVLHVDDSREVRRALAERFPYCVFYYEVGPVVRVLGVGHVRRRPGYWSGR